MADTVKTATQLSVFLVNKPGVLAQVTRALAQAKQNIVAMTLVDSQEHGVLRMVIENAAEAKAVAEAEKFRQLTVAEGEGQDVGPAAVGEPGAEQQPRDKGDRYPVPLQERKDGARLGNGAAAQEVEISVGANVAVPA